MDAGASGSVRTWLRLEGLLVLGVAVVLYEQLDSSWWLFALLFLVPDLSFLGYVFGPRVGAWMYNLMHSYVLAGACALLGYLLPQATVLSVGLIWVAHIGFDRVLGYGLKYPAGFGVTHLGIIGPKAETTKKKN